jgi:uncharacterized membrane protein YkvA (DUF1232 family)
MAQTGFIENTRTWARRIKRDSMALWFARKHPQTPFVAKALAILTVGYALSPIDLIPDFIPVLGYLDDVILLPCLIWLTIRLMPEQVISECRVRADEWLTTQGSKPKSYAGAVAIVLLWIAATIAAGLFAHRSGWI